MSDQYLGREIANQFRILEKIGTGGMGSVYKAEQPDMRRFVAVKILHSRYQARTDLVTRFKREARAMSHLSHPNTARVYLYGQLDDGACYFIMEYLEGQNLAQAVRREGPLEPMRAVNIMIQACAALEEAHREGIVHRDLKPENIFLTTQGGISDYPKVLDFGLAKLGEQQMRPGSLILTQEGMVFGTPEFMSPEQARGEVLDGRSDIYSLGIILYELLTGKLPFDAKQPMQFIQRHIQAAPIPLSERAPTRSFPPGLEAAVMKTLEKRVEDRFQSAAEMAEALKEVAGGSILTGALRAMPKPPHASGAISRPPSASEMAATAPQEQVFASANGAAPVPTVGSSAQASGEVSIPGMSNSKAPWIVLGIGGLLAILGIGAFVAALVIR